MGFVAGPTFPQQLAIRFHYSSNEDSHKDLTRLYTARLWFSGWISRRVKGELIRAYFVFNARILHLCQTEAELLWVSYCVFSSHTGVFSVSVMRPPSLTCISLLHRPFSQCCSHIWTVPLSLCQGLRCWRFTVVPHSKMRTRCANVTSLVFFS